MSKEILYVVDAVSNEKNLEAEDIFEAVEIAIATATRKKYGAEQDFRVDIDRETGDYDTFRRWQIMDDEDPEFESPERHILKSYADDRKLGLEIGEFLEEPVESIEFGRITAQIAKQVIMQKVRHAERQKVADAFQESVGKLVLGTVKRVDRRGIVLDLGENSEAIIPREMMIPREMARMGDRMRGILQEIDEEGRGGPKLIVSRIDDDFLVELVKLEVPEIGQELIDIMGAARDPGSRSKIAVRANVPNLDPVGACVGMRGSRIQTVTNEMNNERVDIIPWDDDIARFVINAMQPAEVLSIVIDEDKKSMDIGVDEEMLAQAIGKGGQNVRLASKLTGWTLNVMSEEEAESKSKSEQSIMVSLFAEKLDVDEEVASILVDEGFSSLDEVAYVPMEEFLKIEEFDEEIIEELRSRARNALLALAITGEGGKPAQDLLEMKGMNNALAQLLASKGICTMEDLAEQATDELVEIEGIDEEQAAKLIMTARAPWFAEAEAEEKSDKSDESASNV
ncbi:transcription termination factor NusA [Cocleimonas flava]|uniref:Transcription termination/antitermination protein NusA n=1 Tax=Cocleimonas flava TaxID=634765 RepID=A0A4R1F0S8_9GAMM|nr:MULTISPECIES: transcription termination factor NusA [Cocleimonas]MEB8433088.1 transcription termination factor NusA [Cocleimonas sp. KMM 6892]MEC4715931.1 transcription termination factor NusA [Cocleimonas sp. KMM 6895]MEC4745392.1 transcription termination factor NusA [Cocleimonas sp. KMM 6896]TCJ87836.1 NusA antitermination factor [Cocleimonas flava]